MTRHDSPGGRGSRWGIVLALLTLAVLCATAIRWHPTPIIWDQEFIRSRLGWATYPDLDGGLVSVVLAGAYNATVAPPDAELSNARIRTIAMAFYSFSAFLLATRVLTDRAAVLLFLALLFSSRFPVLWLSTELLCGGFLSLVAAGVVAGWPSWIVGSLLALFGLCKPDALLPCLAMAGYLLWRGRGWPQRAGLLAGLLGAAGALVVPAFLVHGLRLFGGRAFLSFGQHYSALFALHQLQPPENPWRDWQVYVGAIFPGATSVWDVVRLHPRKYADFVALSVLYGTRKFVTVMNLFLVLLVQRLLSLRRKATALEPFEGILGVSLVGVVPWLLVSFPHVRYFARYYPLLLLSGLHFAEQLEPAGRRRAYALAAAGVAVNCLLLLLDARTRPGSFLLWLPD